MKNLTSLGSSGRLSAHENDDEELSKLAIASFQAREEEIERKKMEVREKVESQLNHTEEETRRLAHVWEELEVLTDPMRKEVSAFGGRIDLVNRDLKSLGQACQKKLVNESEKLKMEKLEKLGKIIESTR